MQKKFQLSKVSIAGIVFLLVLLVLVRVFQTHLFYDPLLAFFEVSLRDGLPEYDGVRVFFGLAFRYFINSILSLGILWLAFKDSGIVKLSATLLLIFFVILIAALFIVLNTDNPSFLILFYIRRFLIQPLFLILFLPAFYYQRHMR